MDEFARSCRLAAAPLDDLIAFHTVFGKTVPDISLNAVANLGYAEARWLKPVWPGDTLRAESEMIGLKENSSGKTGIVWVRTTGYDQDEAAVLSYVRWCMIRKRDPDAPAPEVVTPDLAPSVASGDLVVPEGLDCRDYDFGLAGAPHRLSDHAIGGVIDYVDDITVEKTGHMMATRLWQNIATVHSDTTMRGDGRRPVYGGHVKSRARALSADGWCDHGLEWRDHDRREIRRTSRNPARFDAGGRDIALRMANCPREDGPAVVRTERRTSPCPR